MVASRSIGVEVRSEVGLGNESPSLAVDCVQCSSVQLLMQGNGKALADTTRQGASQFHVTASLRNLSEAKSSKDPQQLIT